MQFCPFQSLTIVLNIGAELIFFIVSGRVFQRRAPLNTRGFPDVLVFLFLVVATDTLFVTHIHLIFLSKNVHMSDGFSCERHLKI